MCLITYQYHLFVDTTSVTSEGWGNCSSISKLICVDNITYAKHNLKMRNDLPNSKMLLESSSN